MHKAYSEKPGCKVQASFAPPGKPLKRCKQHIQEGKKRCVLNAESIRRGSYGRAFTVDSIKSVLRKVEPYACKPIHSIYLYTWHWNWEGLKPLESAAAHIVTKITSADQFYLCATGDVGRVALCLSRCGVRASCGQTSMRAA